MRDYRKISYEAVTVLARTPPFDILAVMEGLAPGRRDRTKHLTASIDRGNAEKW